MEEKHLHKRDMEGNKWEKRIFGDFGYWNNNIKISSVSNGSGSYFFTVKRILKHEWIGQFEKRYKQDFQELKI